MRGTRGRSPLVDLVTDVTAELALGRRKVPQVSTQPLQLENGHFHGTGDGRHPAVVAGQRNRLALAAQVLA